MCDNNAQIYMKLVSTLIRMYSNLSFFVKFIDSCLSAIEITSNKCNKIYAFNFEV